MGPFLSVGANERVRNAKSYQPEPGPWGNLVARTLILEPPQRLAKKIADDAALRETPTWVFQGELEPVLEMLEVFGIDDKWATELGAKGDLTRTDGGIGLRPPEEFLRGLTAEQRSELYGYVAPFVDDNLYHNPFSLHPDGFRFMTAMGPTQLSATMIECIDTWTYRRRGKGTYLSDLHLCLQEAQDAAERVRIVQMINRQFSLRLQLKVSPDDNLSDLSRYWNSNGRNSGVLPLLESVAETSGVELLDIVHLLPGVPRELLHTYPLPELAIGDAKPDCFSTSFSFFADELPSRYLDSIRHVVEARYEKASPPWQLGDLKPVNEPLGFRHLSRIAPCGGEHRTVG